MNLFLDDQRKPWKVTWVKLPPVHWEIVKSYEEFVSFVEKNGVPELVSFDHDLNEEHYKEYYLSKDENNLTSKGVFRYDAMTVKTGYDCAKWLKSHCESTGAQFPAYFVHTLNDIGAENIRNILK